MLLRRIQVSCDPALLMKMRRFAKGVVPQNNHQCRL